MGALIHPAMMGKLGKSTFADMERTTGVHVALGCDTDVHGSRSARTGMKLERREHGWRKHALLERVGDWGAKCVVGRR